MTLSSTNCPDGTSATHDTIACELTAFSREQLTHEAPALVAYLRARLANTHPGVSSDLDGHIEDGHIETEGGAAGLALYGSDVRRAAVLAPIFARDNAPHLLFTVRSASLSSHRGQISFPGGSRDPDDRTLGETALRETYEELAINTAHIALLGALPTVFTAVSNFLVTPYVGWLADGLPMLTPNPDEVAEVFEAPLAALADPAIYHAETWNRGGIAHTVHFYDFGAYRIWGLTGHFLHTLLALLPAA
ncbi:MAG TPA: CoA pyrophosphatase [Ktedonobacterales bacterium]|nr:CoA pyrophosphatase [Ktedonobacterales bacterium]